MYDTSDLRKFYITLFFCYCVETVVARRHFTLQFERVECERKSEITSYFNCSLTKNQKRERGISFSGKLNKPLTALRLDMTVSHVRHQRPALLLINIADFDGCQFLASQSRFGILQILRTAFDKYSNMPSACPVEKGYEMHVKNLLLNPDLFPPYIPGSRLEVHVNIRDHITDVASLLIAVAWLPR